VTRARAVAGLAVLAAIGLAIAASRSDPESPQPAHAAEEAPLAADVHVVALQPVKETLRTVGTLLANESVDVVSELSRRLVSIDVAEGTAVKKGARLFQLDDADLRAQLAELEVKRQLAARTLERQRALLQYEKKALSQQAYDQAATDLQAVDAQIAALRVTLAKTEIRAPFDARVGLRRVSEGAWITPDTLLTTLQDTSRIKIDFTLPERYAGAVAIDQPFSFQVAGRGDAFQGRVIAVEPAIEAATRSVRVRGIADNPTGALVPGAFASVDVPLERAGDGILVPAQAIVPSATGHAVWVLRDGRAELREVEIGLRTRDAVEIVRGLAAGESVLTSNLLRVRAGARVEPAGAGGPG
jgi:membrane fusion protein (multidrug efflux system)